MTPEIQHELGRLEAIIRASGAPWSLQPPAPASRIDELETIVGAKFDPHLRALWEISDGSNNVNWFASSSVDEFLCVDEITPGSFYSLPEAHRWWDLFSPYDQGVYDNWRWEEDKDDRDARIQPVFLHHKLWIPVVNASYMQIYFDADPAPAGQYGQLVAFVHDPDAVDYVASSFLEFFRQSNTTLERVVEDEDDRDYLREWMSW